MAWSLRKRTVEYVIYILFWGVLLLSPLLGAFMKYAIQGDDVFLPTIDELLSYWKFLLPAIILFIINNNILMPSLLYKKEGRRIVLYHLCIVVVCAIVFVAFPVNNPSLPVTPNIEQLPQSLPKGERKVWMFFSDSRNVRILLSLFALVFNICVRLFFFTIRRDESIKELEKEKLRSELEYLKYQINPHFFMNSLNNIHALIDIDKVKAQRTVVELSNMMRYVLYDKSSTFVPMEKEVKFLGSYIDLMRLRYTDKLEIKTDFSTEPQGIYLPSLLFMQFLENAFKHGVTYKKKSLIEVSLKADEVVGNVIFTCRNTLPEAPNTTVVRTGGGIGVENARKRLELLYGGKAQLLISNTGEWYNVELKIPIQYDQVYNS